MLSRVADSLYWTNRYLERAEHTARVIAVNLDLSLDLSSSGEDLGWARAARNLGVSFKDSDPASLAQLLAYDASSRSSIVGCLITARENARQVREQISSEMWEQLNRVFHQMKRVGYDDLQEVNHADFLDSVIAGIHLFQGVTDSTMAHGEGWQFLQAGLYIERMFHTTTLLAAHFAEFPADAEGGVNPKHHLHWVALLRCCAAFEAYCKEYTANMRTDRIGEFLLLNAQFPHSLRFCADRLHDALDALPEGPWGRKSGQVTRLSGRLKATLAYSQIEEITATGIDAWLRNITTLCAQIHSAIYQVFVNYSIEAAVEV